MTFTRPNISRREDWAESLSLYLHANRDKIFAWGRCDCALFVCGAIAAMTGIDMASEFRGQYASREEANTILAAHGGDLSVMAEEIFPQHGITGIPLLMAGRGDVILLDQPNGYALAIVDMDGIHAICPSIKGLVLVPLKTGLKAWRVP